MAEMILSEAEKLYIVNGVKMGIRVDGRQRLDYRQMEIETGLIATANGSARVRLAGTDVLVTVKMEIEAPNPNDQNSGKLAFFVSCSPNAAPEFEGRGGDHLASCLSRMLERLYCSPKVFDTSALIVVAGKHVKVFYVDIEILECGGNLFDLVSMAVKAALFSTRTPCIHITGEDGGKMEFAVSDNPSNVDRLNVSNAPILITHLRVSENMTVVDPTREEECCGPARIVIGVTPQGKIALCQQMGSGVFSSETFAECLKSAKELGVVIQRNIDNKLLQEEAIFDRRIRGFLFS